MEFAQIWFIGTILSMALTHSAIKFFPKLGLLDFPARYGLKRHRIPYPGGLILLFLSVGIFLIDPRFIILLPGLIILGIISFIDDRRSLSPFLRIAIHLAIAAELFWMGVQIKFIGNPFQGTNFELAQYPLISFFLTIVWIVMVQNAMNWFDGIRGLAIGVSGIGFLTLGLLGMVRPELFFDPSHMSLTMANFFLAGCCMGGFYWFWKQKIIMGDTGSQILGFLLATISIFSGAKIATTLLVLSLPVLDAVFVFFRRIFSDKKSPFSGDLSHLHHNLTRKFGESITSILLIVISGIFGTIALFFSGMLKLIGLVSTVLFIFILCTWAHLSENPKNQ